MGTLTTPSGSAAGSAVSSRAVRAERGKTGLPSGFPKHGGKGAFLFQCLLFLNDGEFNLKCLFALSLPSRSQGADFKRLENSRCVAFETQCLLTFRTETGQVAVPRFVAVVDEVAADAPVADQTHFDGAIHGRNSPL